MALSVYKASAGSGKTYQMALEMVAILLDNPEAYKHSLAITFTNKAAGELKTRVVFVLNLLASLNDEKGYLENIRSMEKWTDEEIQDRSSHALSLILHDYSRFSISTIDKFFNRILTGFSYEANIRPDSEISLDQQINREEALDDMLSDFSLNDPVGKWLSAYTRQKIDENENWNIRSSILNESAALAQEDFLQRESSLKEIAEDKNKLAAYRNMLKTLVLKHEKCVSEIGEKAALLLRNSPFEVNDFSYNWKGAVGYLLNVSKREFGELTKRVIDAVENPQSLVGSKKRGDLDLVQFANLQIHPLLAELKTYFDDNIKEYNSAVIILKTFNDFGVFLDLNARLRQLSHERNIYFPFQMSQLLHEIVVRENALFVYEKIGSRYLHFMLDEFQDTSRMQWDILRPLLEEGLSQGGKVLVVGDVKQSIYRWRNGDWSLLDHEVQKQLPGGQEKSLAVNFRSRRDLIRFNNHLLKSLIPAFKMNLSVELGDSANEYSLDSLYADFQQNTGAVDAPYGYIRYEKLTDDKDSDWKTQAKLSMIDEMERLQALGYSPGDMAVLTRDNKSAGEIAMSLMEHDKISNYNFPVVSASSLELIEHPAIKCLVSALVHIANPNNLLALNQLVFAYHRSVLGQNDFQPHPENTRRENVMQTLLDSLPSEYSDSFKNLAAYPLYDLTENLIRWFKLNEKTEIYAYLTAFQDQILIYSERNSADISAFVEWFEKKSPKLDLPEAADAIVISTIHKAKGLQYRFVFMPFTDWDIKRGKTSLWLSPEVEPFSEMPLVMVNYNQIMKNSIFSKAYCDEYYRKQVDMLNMFYVAITRAEEGLWLWSPEKNNAKGEFQKMSDVLNYAMAQSVSNPNDSIHYLDDWNEAWNDEKSVFEFGEVLSKDKNDDEKSNAVLLQDYSLNIRGHKLRYHHPEAFINLDQDEVIRDKTEAGSIAHEILEYCQYKDDLQAACDRVVRAGRIDKMSSQGLIDKLSKAIDLPEVKDWFSPEWDILNEREILLPNATVIKPDRVMVKNNHAIVVDYKFGRKHNAVYEKQVIKYMSALKDMGYERVDGYLWYVFLDEVRQVL